MCISVFWISPINLIRAPQSITQLLTWDVTQNIHKFPSFWPVELEPIPAVIAPEAGYMLDKPPVHHRDDIVRQTTTHTYIYTYGQIIASTSITVDKRKQQKLCMSLTFTTSISKEVKNER